MHRGYGEEVVLHRETIMGKSLTMRDTLGYAFPYASANDFLP